MPETRSLPTELARGQHPYHPTRYEQRPPFNQTWRPMFAPEAPELLEAYSTAARFSYMDLMTEIASLRNDEQSGEVSPVDALRERIHLMSQHLAEIDRLRVIYGLVPIA